MSVTHKKSEKQIGAAELEALRASIMAEVEAARAETEESIISSIRNNLVSIPEQGEEWNEKKSYITGDVVTLDGELHGDALQPWEIPCFKSGQVDAHTDRRADRRMG